MNEKKNKERKKHLHPQLEHFIRTIVLTQLNESLGLSPKENEWKESLLRSVLSGVEMQLDNITTQEQLKVAVTKEVNVLKQTVNTVLGEIEKATKEIPVDVLKANKGKVV